MDSNTKKPTVEDAVRELNGDWINAGGVTHSESFNLLWRNEEGVWYTAHPDSAVAAAGKTTCTKAEFEEVAKRMFTPAGGYVPKPGEWFEWREKRSDSDWSLAFFIGFDASKNLVCHGDYFMDVITLGSAARYDYRPPTPPSKKETWVESVRPLIESAKGNKAVVERIYDALVSGELPAPEPEDTKSP